MHSPLPQGVVDGDAFVRAGELLVRDIPAHINECYQCRQGDRTLQEALRTDDHAEAVRASHQFCAAGNKLIQEYARAGAVALGQPVPSEVAAYWERTLP